MQAWRTGEHYQHHIETWESYAALGPWKIDKETQVATEHLSNRRLAFAPYSEVAKLVGTVASIDSCIVSSDDEEFSQLKAADSIPPGNDLRLLSQISVVQASAQGKSDLFNTQADVNGESASVIKLVDPELELLPIERSYEAGWLVRSYIYMYYKHPELKIGNCRFHLGKGAGPL